MISALKWIPAGIADSNPKRYEFSAAELELIEMMEKQNIDDTPAESSPKVPNKKVVLPPAASDLPADLRMDEYSSDEDENDVKKTAAIGNLLVEDDIPEHSPLNTMRKTSNRGMDSDDSDDDLEDVPDTREYDPLDVSAFDSLGISQVGTKTPTYMEMLEDGEGVDDESDNADVQIRDGDALVVVAKADEEFGSLEVHVYEQKTGNLFIHHDIPLPSFPLCLAQGDVSNSGEAGNFCAVGTFEPGIEIWNLDILNALEPTCVLGGEQTTIADDIMLRNALGAEQASQFSKAKGSSSLRPGSHQGAVMALSWNSVHRHVIASGSADCTVKLWDVTQAGSAGGNAATLTHHTDKVQSVSWHPQEGTLLATGAYDRTVALVDARSPQDAKQVKIKSDCESISWDPFNTQYLTVATEDGTVSCWDVRKFSTKTPAWSKVVNEFGGVTDLSYNPNVPGMLATCSVDKTVALWDTYDANGQPGNPTMCGSKEMGVGKLYTVGFYPSSPWLMGCAGAGKELAIWDMTRESSIRNRFQNRVADAKTPTEEEPQEASELGNVFNVDPSSKEPENLSTTAQTSSKSKKKKQKKKKKAHKAGK